MHKKYRNLSGFIRLNNTALEEVYRYYEDIKMQKRFKALRRKVDTMIRRLMNARNGKKVPSMLMEALRRYE